MKRYYCSICGAKRIESKMTQITSKLSNKSQRVCITHVSKLKDIIDIRDTKEKPVFVEMFSGSGHISEIARSEGYQSITIDFESKFNPDICIDIQNLRRSFLPRSVDIVWASIPCTVYSILSLAHHWDKISIGYRQYYYIPKTKEAIGALRILNKTINLIKQMNPIYYFLENPRGALRHLSHMRFIPFRRTVSYSDYGFNVYKPTDIFTNCPYFKPKEITSAVGKEFKEQIIEIKNSYQRSLVPPDLIKELFKSINFISKNETRSTT